MTGAGPARTPAAVGFCLLISCSWQCLWHGHVASPHGAASLLPAENLTLFIQMVLERAMATHSSTLAWIIPWTEERGRLQSMGLLSRTRLSNFTFTFHFHALEKEMATHSSVLAWRIPMDGGAWLAAIYGVAQSRTRLKRLSSSSTSSSFRSWFE